MSKNDKQRALVPLLRFPEFRDSPEWSVKPLGSVSQFVKKKLPINKVPIEDYVSTENILPDYGGIERATRMPPSGSATQFKPNDVLLANIRPYLRKVWRSNKSGGASNDVIVIRAKPVLRSNYFPLILANDAFINYVMKTAKGVKMPRGDIASMKAYSVYYPEPHEQQKIADCLGSLDDLIAAEGRKLAALRDHKKGLMQQLFPREGETRPRLRFPEFKDAGDWANELFEALYDVKRNNTYSRDQLNYVEGTIKNIHYGDIHTRFATHFRVDEENVPYVNPDVLSDDVNPDVYCRPGDVIFADASEDLADVGKCIEIIEVGDERVLSGSHTILARPRTSSIAVGFAGYLFKSRRLREGIEKEAQGTKVMQISPKRLAKIDVLFPPDEGEQQRIADCLSALDALIAAQAEKLHALRTHKRGLMQKLFPSPDGSAL